VDAVAAVFDGAPHDEASLGHEQATRSHELAVAHVTERGDARIICTREPLDGHHPP